MGKLYPAGAVHFSYFMLFASLYTQLPGLHGPQGIDPYHLSKGHGGLDLCFGSRSEDRDECSCSVNERLWARGGGGGVRREGSSLAVGVQHVKHRGCKTKIVQLLGRSSLGPGTLTSASHPGVQKHPQNQKPKKGTQKQQQKASMTVSCSGTDAEGATGLRSLPAFKARAPNGFYCAKMLEFPSIQQKQLLAPQPEYGYIVKNLGSLFC